MIVDSGGLADEVWGDVCIVGTGPAGLSIALELEKTGKKILVLEGGDLKPTSDSQEIYNGTSKGIKYSLGGSRIRAFGGSSNCWSGWTRQFENLEFSQREWMPNSSWPISHSEISPHYAAAGRILGVEGISYNPFQAARLGGRTTNTIWSGSTVAEPRIWQISSNTKVGIIYQQHLAGSPNVQVCVSASVFKVQADELGDKIAAVHFRDSTGRRRIARSPVYVLALGGIETARLLLNSPLSNGTPIGDKTGWLGKGFMEHPARINGWRLYLPGDAPQFMEADGATSSNVGRPDRVGFGFGLTEEIQRRHKLPSLWCVVGPALTPPEQEANTASKLLGSMLSKPVARVRAYDLTWAMEQEAGKHSFIELTPERDSSGMRKVSLSWNVNQRDVDAVKKIQELIAADLLRRKVGRLRLMNSFEVNDDNIDFGQHHMGATRMSARYEDGVVDRNCRVFETRNLFIAGGGVFPTSAVTNPTLALTATALRLASHLKPII